MNRSIYFGETFFDLSFGHYLSFRPCSLQPSLITEDVNKRSLDIYVDTIFSMVFIKRSDNSVEGHSIVYQLEINHSVCGRQVLDSVQAHPFTGTNVSATYSVGRLRKEYCVY